MVIKSVKGASEIVGISDVLGAGTRTPAGVAIPAGVGDIEIARLEKWIVLADKGISLIGRAEGIIRPIMERQGIMREIPAAPPQYVRLPPGEGANINAEKSEHGTQNTESSAPIPANSPAPVPAPAPGSLPIDPMQIAGALRMIDNQAPGITATQIADLIEKNPEAVGRLMGAAMQGGLLK